jgi:hypothetical protein
MAITLNEAIEKGPILKKEIDDEKQKAKDNFLIEAKEKIDRIIALNIDEILKRPIEVPTDLNCSRLYNYIEDIDKMYQDFTIDTHWGPFGIGKGCVQIKLADKDWDWKGYGIKEQPVIQPEIKKLSFIEKLKQWL